MEALGSRFIFGRDASARITIYFDTIRFEKDIKHAELTEMVSRAMERESVKRQATIGIEAKQEQLV